MAEAAGDPLGAVSDLSEVRAAVEQARDAIERLRANDVLRRRRADVAAESTLRAARASAALDGVVWTLDEVRSVDRRRRPGAGVVYGALRAAAAVSELSHAFERAPRQVFARLHALAAAGLVDDEDLGRPRHGDACDDDVLAGLGTPPAAQSVVPRLEALTGLVLAATATPAPVLAAVVHGELLALRPFARANGVVARAASRLVLRSRGLDPDGLAVSEVGHLDDPTSYVDACRGYATGEASAVAAWVVHCCGAMVLGAQEGIAICEALAR
jgi:hypothetical protein